MNKQKGLSLILIILIIAAVLGGYLIYQKQTRSVSISQPFVRSIFKFKDSSEDATGRRCGGFHAELNPCPLGYYCDYEEKYADVFDAQGKCVKE